MLDTAGVVSRAARLAARLKYELTDDRPILFREAEIDFIDDGPGKPVGIQTHIGKRPIAAFGNSDGDYQMLEWRTKGPGRTLGMIVHQDHAAREFAYDRDSHIGKLDKAMDAAPKEGWVLISMKDDWKQIFPSRPQMWRKCRCGGLYRGRSAPTLDRSRILHQNTMQIFAGSSRRKSSCS